MLKGLRVPEPLRKYLPGAPDFIPFTKELPKETVAKKGGKDKGTAKAKPTDAEAGEAAAAAVSDAAEKVKSLAV